MHFPFGDLRVNAVILTYVIQKIETSPHFIVSFIAAHPPLLSNPHWVSYKARDIVRQSWSPLPDNDISQIPPERLEHPIAPGHLLYAG